LDDPACMAGIQNGGVKRMSEMSSILGIHPGRPGILSQRADLEGNSFSGW